MSGLFTVVVVMCASALICSLVQTFVTDGSTKKIISLVLGAFIICCMVVPVKMPYRHLIPILRKSKILLKKYQQMMRHTAMPL